MPRRSPRSTPRARARVASCSTARFLSLPPIVLLAFLLLFISSVAVAQTQPSVPLAPAATARGRRPVPGPVYEIPGFTSAVARGTRTRTGAPGPAYWVQHARYAIDASLDVPRNRISGRERVVYLNNSPDTLRRLAVYVRQNAFKAGNPRRDPSPITGGMTLTRVVVNGRVMPA